jgi:hypothetical protein
MDLHVRDNAISEELFRKVAESPTFFPKEMSLHDNIGEYLNSYHDDECDCYAPYMFWDGWHKSPADTLRKQVIQEIWSTPGLLPFPLEEVVGFEYWTRAFSVGQYLGVHCDEDTFLYADKHLFRGPATGCVWYGTTESTGGYLELHDAVLPEGPFSLERYKVDPLLSPIEERERIMYKPNRLIAFDAGHRLHEATKVQSGVRQVMVVNVWHKDCPPTALETGDFFYE